MNIIGSLLVVAGKLVGDGLYRLLLLLLPNPSAPILTNKRGRPIELAAYNPILLAPSPQTLANALPLPLADNPNQALISLPFLRTRPIDIQYHTDRKQVHEDVMERQEDCRDCFVVGGCLGAV